MVAKAIFGIMVGTFTIVGAIADYHNKQKVELIMIFCIMLSVLIYIPFVG